MNIAMRHKLLVTVTLAVLVGFWPGSAAIAGPLLQDKPKAESDAAPTRITIEVTAGAGNVPVENASVYLKYGENGKKLALNVKTNREGIAHVPGAATGRVLVQVVAQGWKTYGRYTEITDTNQTIKVHLDSPPHWY